MSYKAVQLENAIAPIERTDMGNSILDKEEQSANAASEIKKTVFGISVTSP